MEQANTVKIDTIIWSVAGLLIPLWPISLPVCWYLAFKSYKRGVAVGSVQELRSAHELFQQGVLTEEEFQKIKNDALRTGKK